MAQHILKKTAFCILLVMTFCCTNAYSFWGKEDPLVTVNSVAYQTQDYLDWWQEWREGPELPESPKEYIDWLLLSTEAKQMQLQDQPLYRKKVEVFLKVRSLMLLKQESVSDKTQWPDEDRLRQIYQTDYTPIWQLRTITFHDRLQLDAFMAKLQTTDVVDTETILTEVPEQLGNAVLSSPVSERQPKLPQEISALVKDKKDQQFTAPYLWNNTWQIIEILGFSEGSDEDFIAQKDAIHHHYIKKQQSRLTAELLMELIEKYQVEIDENIINSISYDGVASEHANDIVLSFLSYKITATELHRVALKHYQSSPGYEANGVQFEKVIVRVLNDIISQNLTNAEALDRHYELKRPFKPTYDFYCNNRLIKELERKLIVPHVTVSEQEQRAAYEQRKKEFAEPELIKILRVETSDQDLALRLNEKLRQGVPFKTALLPLSPNGFNPETLPLQSYSEPIQQRISSLAPGKSTMIEENGGYVFIHFIQSEHQQLVSFDEVKEIFASRLKQQKFSQLRQDLIHKLRQLSTIEVNQHQWQRCLDQLKG